MAETVEKICGYKPENNVVIHFLKTISGETSLLSVPKPTRIEAPITKKNHVDKIDSDENVSVHSYDSKKPRSFKFDEHTYEVHTWISLLKTFIQVIAQKHPSDIHMLTSLVGKQRPYFTTDSQLLRKASRIPNSPMFFETHFSANGIVHLINQVLKTLNYDSESIKISLTNEQ